MLSMPGRCNDGIWVVSFLPSCTVEIFRQFRIVDECLAVRLCPLYNCYTVVICIVVAPYGVVAVEITDYNLGRILCANEGSTNCSLGGLYT